MISAISAVFTALNKYKRDTNVDVAFIVSCIASVYSAVPCFNSMPTARCSSTQATALPKRALMYSLRISLSLRCTIR